MSQLSQQPRIFSTAKYWLSNVSPQYISKQYEHRARVEPSVVNVGVGAAKDDTPDLSFLQHLDGVSPYNNYTYLFASVYSDDLL